MVRRLVQQQEVGALQRQPGQRDAAALPAAERADLAEHVVAAEQELAQEVARLRHRQVLHVQDRVQHRFVRVQPGLRLRQVAHLHAGAEPHAALQRRNVAEDGLEQRRLARAVGADQRHAVAAPDLDVGAAKSGGS